MEKNALGRYEITRIPSGIDGLDELIEGGFPFPSVVLVAGMAGAGKTTFALRYLAEGARRGETGLFITTLSEPTQWMLRFASQFDFLRPETFGETIHYLDLGDTMMDTGPKEILDIIDKKVAELLPQRIVIDPITVLEIIMGPQYRRFLFDLTNHLKNWNATTLLTGEIGFVDKYPREVAYAADAVILLTNDEDETGQRRKYLEVLKMRGTNHRTGRNMIDISRKDGIVVLKARF
jgi:circadian clock protein KaiC